MSENAARTHTHTSNRAQNRGGGERKVVFKGVLDNPFRIPWPSVPCNVQNTALALCLAELKGVAEYRKDQKRKHKSEGQRQPPHKRRKMMDMSTEKNALDLVEMPVVACNQIAPAERNSCPPILQHLVSGINEVTKRMESQIREKRFTTIMTKNDSSGRARFSPLQIIFACRADINPTILIDHLPHLVAAYNSLQPQTPVKLVPLPAGAEESISKAIGFRKAAVMGIDSSFSNLTAFMELLDPIPTLTATWLTSSIAANKFVATHIKQIRTSAPKDMRAEKQRRKEEKTLKKSRKKTHPRSSEVDHSMPTNQ